MNRFPTGRLTALAVVFLLLGKAIPLAHAQPVEQATVEAAMILQILSFTEWTNQEDNAETAKTIGVFESDNYLAAFQSLVAGPRFAGRYTVVSIDPTTDQESLDKLDALFFSQPEPAELPRILRKIERKPIVLIGAFDGFLDQGGLVNLVKRQRKMSFEIHLDNSQRRGIEYRAKLLRLATRIVKE